MIPAAEWLMTAITLDGEQLDLGKARFRGFRRELDMRAGTLERSFTWETETGKELRLAFLRFADMVHRERAYQRITLEALNFSGDVEVSSGLSFDVTHEGYRKCFWQETRADILFFWLKTSSLSLRADSASPSYQACIIVP